MSDVFGWKDYMPYSFNVMFIYQRALL